VRHVDLLDWLERRLGLTWLEHPPPPADDVALPPAHLVIPPKEPLDALRELVVLGYYRGILNLWLTCVSWPNSSSLRPCWASSTA